eukprot:264972-Chlamydomonas_euryale.AAC.1
MFPTPKRGLNIGFRVLTAPRPLSPFPHLPPPHPHTSPTLSPKDIKVQLHPNLSVSLCEQSWHSRPPNCT